jgi:hypothetical protein
VLWAPAPQAELDCFIRLGYTIPMVVTSIREFNRAVPFKPYRIHMASGDSFEVPHPDFVSVSPKGSFVIVIDAKEHPHHLSSFLIERVTLHNGHRARKKSQRS